MSQGGVGDKAGVAPVIETPIPGLPRYPSLRSVVSAPFLPAGCSSPNDYLSAPYSALVPVSPFLRTSDYAFQVARPTMKTRESSNSTARDANDLVIFGKPGKGARWPDSSLPVPVSLAIYACPAPQPSSPSSGGGLGQVTLRKRRALGL